MTSQLDRIRDLTRNFNNALTEQPQNTIAIASGKGGTGKTFLAANLSYLLAKSKRVLLFDFDFQLSNIHTLFNINPDKTLNAFLDSRCSLNDIITKYNNNLHIVFGNSTLSENFNPSVNQINYLLETLKLYQEQYDYILFDLGAGIGEENLFVLSKSRVKLLLSTPEPTALMDAYMLIKQLKLKDSYQDIYIAINRCIDVNEGESSFSNLKAAVNHFLKINIEYLGQIPESLEIRKSIINQLLYAEQTTEGIVFKALNSINEKVIKIQQLLNINQSSNHRTFNSI